MRRQLGAVLALASPPLAAIGFAFWLDLGPRYPLDTACGISDLTGLGSLALLALPSLLVAVWARRSRKSVAAGAVWVAGTLLFTAVVFLLAWLIWFGQHHCGE